VQVSNEHSIEIAKEVYGSMLVEKSTLKTQRSAEGLSRTQRSLREKLFQALEEGSQAIR